MSKQKQLLPTNHIASNLRMCGKQIFGIDFQPEKFFDLEEKDYLYSNGDTKEFPYYECIKEEDVYLHKDGYSDTPFWMPFDEYEFIKDFVSKSVVNETSILHFGYIPEDIDSSNYKMWVEIGTLKV